MTIKFIDSFFDSNSGISTVTVQCRGENYYGEALCHPDDIQSNFMGCHLAEARAQIKALKAEKKRLVQEYKDWQVFVKKCEQYKNFDKESSTARAMYRQLNRKKREVDYIEKWISVKKQYIDNKIKTYDKMVNKNEKD